MPDELLFKDIRHYGEWKSIVPVSKGWSKDTKYYIETANSERQLLKLASIAEYEKKKNEFEKIQMAWQLGINMSRPLDFGVCAKGTMVYTILSWLEGESAAEILPELSETEQYEYGVSAGQLLNKIHSIPANENEPDWDYKISRKVELKLSQYKDCVFTVPDDEKILRFIYDNLKYIKGRLQTFQHGDYHTGNMIIGHDKQLGLIDFNRLGFGDPWEEYNRLTFFSRAVSIPFSRGQIHAYFDNRVPDLFFTLMALYTAIDALFGIVWAVPFGEEEIASSLERARMVFEDYCDFETCIPSWYE